MMNPLRKERIKMKTQYKRYQLMFSSGRVSIVSCGRDGRLETTLFKPVLEGFAPPNLSSVHYALDRACQAKSNEDIHWWLNAANRALLNMA